MTLTIELAPETMQVLADRAARLGMPMERIAADVLHRDLQTERADSDAARCEARQHEILAMVDATPPEWARTQQQSAQAAASFYETPEGRAELADWRGRQGEDFAGYEDERKAA